jgi:transposase
MPQPTQFVGIDLHQDTVTVAVLPEGASECAYIETFLPEPSRLRPFLKKVSKGGPIRACYEASSCGYVLQRQITSWGWDCQVIAPSLMPRSSGDRVKTDRRDAERLAKHLRAGLLTPVRVPSQAEERVRSLVRCRGTLTREILASRHYILKLLQSRGHRFRDGRNWSQAHWRWLRSLDLRGEDALTLMTYLTLLEDKLRLRHSVDERLEALAKEEPWRGPVGRLCCLRGVKILTALTLLSEIGDARRFATARQLMAYVGLNVCEYSSGGSQRRGGITKAGNAHCRSVLVEAAWHYRHRPRVSKDLEARMTGQPEAVRAHAMRAQKRLHQRFGKLEARMASSKAVVAVARELVGFVWALLRGEEGLLVARAPRG